MLFLTVGESLGVCSFPAPHGLQPVLCAGHVSRQQPALTHLNISGSILGIIWKPETPEQAGLPEKTGGEGLGSTQQMGFHGRGVS